MRDGLRYTSFIPDEFRSFIQNETSFIIDEMIITEDMREYRKGEFWLNAFLKKGVAAMRIYTTPREFCTFLF